MDTLRVKELRERIERAKAEEKNNLAFLRRDRHKQIETAQKAGADQASLDALTHEFYRFEAGIIAQAAEIIGKWQGELDELLEGDTGKA